MRKPRLTVLAAVFVLSAALGCRDSKPPEPRTHGAGAAEPSSDAPSAAAAPAAPAAPKLSTPDKAQPENPEAARPDAVKPASGMEACVDRWLKEHNLNQYGDPPDTMYAGGTPLFDESTGQRTDRMEYVLRRHPHAKVACQGDGGGAGK